MHACVRACMRTCKHACMHTCNVMHGRRSQYLYHIDSTSKCNAWCISFRPTKNARSFLFKTVSHLPCSFFSCVMAARPCSHTAVQPQPPLQEIIRNSRELEGTQNQICLRALREINIIFFSALRAKSISFFFSALRAKSILKIAPRFARNQYYVFLRASREINITIFSALRAKSVLNFSPRFARKLFPSKISRF